jgi:hypothetical protein
MGLGLALRAFFYAWKNPDKAKKFIDNVPFRSEAVEASEPSHLRLLAILQQSGRLIDFFKEDISQFTDAQVGTAVRKIHQDCSKSLEEIVTIRPVMEESEGSTVRVPFGYDPSVIKVIGKVNGEPPFSGMLVHKGWKAHKRSLPKKMGESNPDVICPAEVEVR